MDFLTPIYEFELNTGSNESVRKKAVVPIGSPFHLKCSVVGEIHQSDPELLVAFNGQFLDNNPNAQYRAESSSVIVKVDRFNESWTGLYECSVKNPTGRRVKSTIHVEGKSDASNAVRPGEIPCDSAYANYCENDGLCYYHPALNAHSCRCKSGYSGSQCEYYLPDVINVGSMRGNNCDNNTSTVLFGLFACTSLIFALICILFYWKHRDATKQKPKTSDTSVTLSLVPPPSPTYQFTSEPNSPRSSSDPVLNYQPAVLRFSIEHGGHMGGSISAVRPVASQPSFSRTNDEPTSPFHSPPPCCHSACVNHGKIVNPTNSQLRKNATTNGSFTRAESEIRNDEELHLTQKLSTLSDDLGENRKLTGSDSVATIVEMEQVGRRPRVRTCSRN